MPELERASKVELVRACRTSLTPKRLRTYLVAKDAVLACKELALRETMMNARYYLSVETPAPQDVPPQQPHDPPVEPARGVAS